MAKELSESMKAFQDMMWEQDKKSELLEKQERINKQVTEYRKELNEIFDRAYQTAIEKVVSEYQEKLCNSELSEDEISAIEQERKDFEADPSIKGIIREKCPIVNEQDQQRALQLAELLKDTDKLGEVEDVITQEGFLEQMQGFAERQQSKQTTE